MLGINSGACGLSPNWVESKIKEAKSIVSQPKPPSEEHIARVCHEANRAYCIALGDVSHLPWDSAPEWQRESAIEGVKKHLENGYLEPRQSHDLWMSHKLRDGWTYGPVKDVRLKQHPSLLPYDELPLSEKYKDFLFSAVCATFGQYYREYQEALRVLDEWSQLEEQKKLKTAAAIQEILDCENQVLS